MAKILVVEDDRIIQRIMKHRLEAAGHDVILASDGGEGVSLAQIERPDIILMDLWLPQVNGWEATRQIKASPVTNNIPVIALTGAATLEEQQLSAEAGCEAYIMKPVNFTELFAQIDLLLPIS